MGGILYNYLLHTSTLSSQFDPNLSCLFPSPEIPRNQSRAPLPDKAPQYYRPAHVTNVTSATSLMVNSARCGTMLLDLMVTITKLGSHEWFI